MADSPMTARGMYERLSTERDPYLRRARDASRLTIPSLLPEEGSGAATVLETPFQSVGARGVNNLGAKLMLALFPPGSPFFRFQIDEKILAEAEDQGENAEEVFEEALSRLEQKIMDAFEVGNSRPVMSSTIKHLIVTGNGLLQRLTGGWNLHPLTSYVVKRDSEGTVIEIVLKEGLSPMTLPDRVAAIVEEQQKLLEKQNDRSADEVIDLFTRVSLEGDKWTVYQEVLDREIPETRGTFPLDKPPFMALRWEPVEGESYGRGHVEQYMGDLASLESVSQAIIEFAAAASKILFLVDEGGVTDIEELVKAPSGAMRYGALRDIGVLQLEKTQDFQVANAVAERLERRLEQAFLLTSSIQRNAERVTAEEIRIMAGELEQALGGVYSTLSAELQRPLVTLLMAQLQKAKKLPALPKGALSAQIITGLEGLGRQGDLMKLDALIAGIGQTFGPEAVAQYVNVGAYAQRRATALGLDTQGLVRSDEEVQQMRQQAQQAEMMKSAAGPAVGAMKDVAIESARQAAPAPEGQPAQ